MLDRRQSMKFIGATAVAAVTPLPPAIAASAIVSVEPTADALALRDRVQKLVDGFDPSPHFANAQYRKIFRISPATDSHCGKCDARLEDQIEFVRMRIGEPPHENGQRWIFRIPHREVDLGYALLVRPHVHHTDGDIIGSLHRLTYAIAQQREIDAAAVFNTVTTYHSEVCGDGKPLCSEEHPRDDGVWRNVLMTPSVLTTAALEQALTDIRTQFVDEAGIRIIARGRRLVVPVTMSAAAVNAVAGVNREAFPELGEGFIEWDYLTNDRHWFVLTDVPGLRHSERRPYTINVSIDGATGYVIVVGSEKRGFGCHDPRAVFGSLPA